SPTYPAYMIVPSTGEVIPFLMTLQPGESFLVNKSLNVLYSEMIFLSASSREIERTHLILPRIIVFKGNGSLTLASHPNTLLYVFSGNDLITECSISKILGLRYWSSIIFAITTAKNTTNTPNTIFLKLKYGFFGFLLWDRLEAVVS